MNTAAEVIQAMLNNGTLVYVNREYVFSNAYLEKFPIATPQTVKKPKSIKEEVFSAKDLMDRVVTASKMPFRVKNLTGSTYTVKTKTDLVKTALHNKIIVKKTCTEEEAVAVIKEYYVTTDLPNTLHNFFKIGLFDGLLEEIRLRKETPGMNDFTGKIERQML